MDFVTPQNLSGILTQGSPSADRWVYTYTVATSNDGKNFDPVKDVDGKVVKYYGNIDRNTVSRNYFPRVSFFFLYQMTTS